MVEPSKSKNLVQHIAGGRLSEICLLCLIPLEDICSESIFTLICKEDAEYCIADALKAVCQFEFHRSDNYNVCIDCFKSATDAYKFHIKAKRSMEIITHNIQELLNNLENIEIIDMEKPLLVQLIEYTPRTSLFDFNIDGIGRRAGRNGLRYGSIVRENGVKGNVVDSDYNNSKTDCIDFYKAHNKADNNNSMSEEFNDTETKNVKNSEENIILVVQNEGTSLDGKGDSTYSKFSSDDEIVMIVNEKKVRKKRDPMVYTVCSQCPVKYRFVAKLKDHMKTVHNIELFYCKVCKIITENKNEYEEHLKSHTDKHQCMMCNIVYKRADTLVAHMKLHEKGKQFQLLENANMCDQCGAILEDEASLEEHVKNKHVKRFTCYYCGRMYHVEGSFERHIKKHEEYWNKKQGPTPVQSQASTRAITLDKSKRSVCQTCGKDFVDERALLWHQRLHDNDRPFTCQVCERSFVSKNRRNQHALCAHTPPRRRCPLCPALFHLRSMVNTHLKKVHLKAHKRRNRTSKHQHVFWRTHAVPIQELSIDVQDDVLELRAQQLPESAIDSPSTSLFD